MGTLWGTLQKGGKRPWRGDHPRRCCCPMGCCHPQPMSSTVTPWMAQKKSIRLSTEGDCPCANPGVQGPGSLCWLPGPSAASVPEQSLLPTAPNPEPAPPRALANPCPNRCTTLHNPYPTLPNPY